ncbi:unnamed protein product [Acanthoscelides obtectus]|uniref:MADF domain-containing protein n=2 Tax=Acanthoscelides obtectus TaxID=200917 RepID=A0A9P0NSP9_ACAOB|nr:unnamed protein product [Acanthoscelides obtectus]CAK1641391.1 hypothetical protein AOBTE_LOCUS12378 [Acanthoscelides obtectus]
MSISNVNDNNNNITSLNICWSGPVRVVRRSVYVYCLFIMSWNREEVTLLLEEYQKWPNLYKVKSANYKNRNLRRQALDAVVQALRSLKPNVTAQDVQAKFQALKQNASKERRKCLESQRSGAGSDDITEPSLWYHNLIGYVFDNSEERGAFDSLESEDVQEQDITLIEQADDEDALAEEVLSAAVSPSGALEHISTPSHSRSSSRVSMTSAPKKRKRKEEDTDVMGEVKSTLQHISQRLGQTREKSSNQIFGEYVA